MKRTKDCPDAGALAALLEDKGVDAAVEEHVRNCEACKRRLASLVYKLELAADYEAFLQQEPSDADQALVDRISARVAAKTMVEVPDRSQRRAGRHWVTLALACSVLVALGGALWYRSLFDGEDVDPSRRPIVFEESAEFGIRFRQTSGVGESRAVPQDEELAYRVSRSYEVVFGNLTEGFVAIVALSDPPTVVPG